MRAAVALALLAACGLDVGPPGEWVPVDELIALEPELGAPPRDASPSPTLRVVTYNVHFGEDAERIAASLRADPELRSTDVLLIQEQEHYPDEPVSRTRRLAEALEMGWAYVPARAEGAGTHGLAILSRYPLDDVMEMELPYVEGGRRRTAIRADVVAGGRRLRIVDVHLDTRINIRDRILQLRPAVWDAPDAVIIGGDFNTNPYAWEEGLVPLAPVAAVADIDQAPLLDDYMAHLGFDTPTAALGPTHSVLGIETRLDAIYTRGVHAMPGAVARDVDASDHWPMWIDVDL